MRGADTRSRHRLAQVPEFTRTVHVAAVVPEYGQDNANKAQVRLAIPIGCATRKLACLLHLACAEAAVPSTEELDTHRHALGLNLDTSKFVPAKDSGVAGA